ncbi:MAG: hypothetical protein ACRBCT_08335 [Alphaproteobacteria bacterium]
MKLPFITLQSWVKTRRAMHLNRSALESRQKKLWQGMQATIRKTPALSDFAGCSLKDFPITLPEQMRKNFKDWNSLRISDEEAHAAAQNAEDGGVGEVLPGVVAGYSTGTSGTRGLFLASATERAIYQGQSMAKLLPFNTLHKGVKIMLVLRADSKLYSNGKRSGPFQFMYCPLSLSLEEKQKAIESFKPTILIAPSHVLAELATTSLQIPSLIKCYYGSEPMGNNERDWIQKQLGTRPDPIYQATEGFLGAPCKHGRLHLNEDGFIFELELVPGTSGYQLIATDLFRRSQPIIRVKLDDYIELEHSPCPCGFVGRTIKPIAGRVQNLWRYPDKTITPESVTNSLERTLGAQTQWIASACKSQVKLYLKNTIANDTAGYAAKRLKHDLKLDCPVDIETMQTESSSKRQRIKWSSDNG